MYIRIKSRSLAAKLSDFSHLNSFYLTASFNDHAEKLRGIGFSLPPIAGESLLPGAAFGPASRRNCLGFAVVHREQPKQVAYRQLEWHWYEWRGRHNRIQRSDIREVSYKRYP